MLNISPVPTSFHLVKDKCETVCFTGFILNSMGYTRVKT